LLTEIPFRTGKQLLRATTIYAKDSTLKSWWCIISTAVLLAMAFAGTLWNVHPIGKVVCSVLSGLLLLRFFVIYHDQQHRAILPKSRIASALMWIFGVFALSASSVWRSSHNHHHNHNSKLRGSHIGSFPIMTKVQFLASSGREKSIYLFTRHPFTILFGYLFTFAFGMCLRPFLSNPKEHFDCLLALLVHVGIGVALVMFGGWSTLLLTQTLPFFITYAIGTYLFYAQHNFPEVSFSNQSAWTMETAAMQSSSYLKTNRLMAWFTANIGYHHIHHLNARIPFYRLPDVILEVPEVQNPKRTSFHPADVLRCLKLKVWDPEIQRMIPRPY
jgi:omega-6 fatty acid desaturase (delta-12 desaturase)